MEDHTNQEVKTLRQRKLFHNVPVRPLRLIHHVNNSRYQRIRGRRSSEVLARPINGSL